MIICVKIPFLYFKHSLLDKNIISITTIKNMNEIVVLNHLFVCYENDLRFYLKISIQLAWISLHKFEKTLKP